MSTEKNKAIVRRSYEEGLNRKNLEVVDQLFAANYTGHPPGGLDPVRGLAARKQFDRMFLTAFPDLHLTIEDEIAEGDKVALRITARGTHRGEFVGIPPTGQQAMWTGSSISHLVDGKIVEQWGEQDILGMLQQLGLIPGQGRRGSHPIATNPGITPRLGDQPASSEENKALIRRFIEEVNNKGSAVAAEQFLGLNYLDHSAPPGLPAGPEGWRQLRTKFFNAFSNIGIAVEDMIAEKDKVAVRFTMQAIHTGELMGIPPTGKQVILTGLDVNRFENGKIVERWGNQDDLGLMQQLGVIPAISPAGALPGE